MTPLNGPNETLCRPAGERVSERARPVRPTGSASNYCVTDADYTFGRHFRDVRSHRRDLLLAHAAVRQSVNEGVSLVLVKVHSVDVGVRRRTSWKKCG